ncbi:MAG: FliH/SctL family protein [Acidobacteriota bacterium]
MLAKVHKKNDAPVFAPFSLPRFGDATGRTHGYGAQDLDDVQHALSAYDLNSSDAVDEIIQNARDEAARIIAEAKNSIQHDAPGSMSDVEIQSEIDAAVSKQVAEIRGRLADTIEHISSLADEITSRAEKDLVDLALKIAKKVVRREVTIDREIALTLVKVSLSNLNSRTVATVHLNSEDLAFVEAHRDACNFRGALSFVEDQSISVGGCLVHTETGDIDAGIGSQFDEIARGLFA